MRCRRFWHPIHTQTPYRPPAEIFRTARNRSRARCGLPSAFTLSDEDVAAVCAEIRHFRRIGGRLRDGREPARGSPEDEADRLAKHAIRHPEDFVIGEDSIVDDYCYFSTTVRIGRCTHIASGCSVAGGADMQFEIGDFCSLSSGVKIWCTSDDFVNDLVTIIPPGVEQVKKI